MKKQSILVLDFIGISSASLCMIHCLVFPILSMLPLYFLENPWIDILFVSTSMFVVSKIIIGIALKAVKVILITSVFVLVISIVLETIWDLNTPLVLIGGIGMIIGHLLNYKSHSK